MLWWTGKLGKNDWFSQELALKTCRLFSAGLYNSVFALHHRDLVHRQTASAVVQHMSLGVLWLWLWRFSQSFAQLCLAKCLRNVPSCYPSCDGGAWGSAGGNWTLPHAAVLLAGKFFTFPALNLHTLQKGFSLTCKDLKAQCFFLPQ